MHFARICAFSTYFVAFCAYSYAFCAIRTYFLACRTYFCALCTYVVAFCTYSHAFLFAAATLPESAVDLASKKGRAEKKGKNGLKRLRVAANEQQSSDWGGSAGCEDHPRPQVRLGCGKRSGPCVKKRASGEKRQTWPTPNASRPRGGAGGDGGTMMGSTDFTRPEI